MPDPVIAPAAETPAPAAQPAATPAPATPVVPRDPSTGRFTKEGLASVGLGETPAPTVPATVETPAPEVPATTPGQATPAVPDADIAALEAYLAAQPAATPAPTPQAPEPQLSTSPEAEQLGKWAAHPQLAADAVQAVQTHIALNNDLNNGNIQGALARFHPNVIEAIKEHFYQQNKDAWADRYTKEAAGFQADPRVAMLEREMQSMRQALEQRQQTEQQQRQQYQTRQQQQALAANLSKYMDGLFESVKMKDSPDRQFLEGPLLTSMTPQQRANIAAGRFGDLGAKFRELYPTWKQRWQPAAPQAQPSASTQLMATPSGASSTPGSAPEIVDGKRTSDFWKRGLGLIRKTGS